MMDQAETLRRKMMVRDSSLGKTIAVVSGKGGVGKSNFSINFAASLAAQGNRVVLLDMDIGMGNVHILVGRSVQSTILHYLEDDTCSIEDVIEQGEGVSYIFGGSGLNKILEWDQRMISRLEKAYETLQLEYDYLIFDMGAGASTGGIELISAVDDIIVVTTPEPTSVMDAYSMMKIIYMRDEDKQFSLICNRATSEKEGRETLQRLQLAMQRFLSKDLTLLGSLPEDSSVRKAVTEQTPFLLQNPSSAISRTMVKLAENYTSQTSAQVHMRSTSFFQRLSGLFTKR